MKVLDHEVTELQYAAAIDRMQRSDFKAADIDASMREPDVAQHTSNGCGIKFLSNRVADRTIQQNRKLWKIDLIGGSRWKWVSRR